LLLEAGAIGDRGGVGGKKNSKGFGRRTDLTRVWMRGADWLKENPACGIWTAGRDGALARDARALSLSGGQERPTVEVMDEGRTLAVELAKKKLASGRGRARPPRLSTVIRSVLFSHCLPSEGRSVVMPPVVTSQSSCTTHRRPSCIMVGSTETSRLLEIPERWESSGVANLEGGRTTHVPNQTSVHNRRPGPSRTLHVRPWARPTVAKRSSLFPGAPPTTPLHLIP
jgi:hypothetical protein